RRRHPRGNPARHPPSLTSQQPHRGAPTRSAVAGVRASGSYLWGGEREGGAEPADRATCFCRREPTVGGPGVVPREISASGRREGGAEPADRATCFCRREPTVGGPGVVPREISASGRREGGAEPAEHG